jgi:hypothetical protein
MLLSFRLSLFVMKMVKVFQVAGMRAFVAEEELLGDADIMRAARRANRTAVVRFCFFDLSALSIFHLAIGVLGWLSGLAP